MKKIIFSIILIIGLLGCTDLDEQVFSSASPLNYYQNVSDANSAVISIYNSLNRTVNLWDFGMSSLVFMPSPHVVSRVPWRKYWGDYSVTSSDQVSLPVVWNQHYQAIFRANVVIAELEVRSFATDSDNITRKEMIAEAKWIRAWCFFNLVRLYGDIPMPLLAASNIEEAQLPRTSIAGVYAQIIEDLMIAEKELPMAKRSGDMIGRPIIGTAKFLLGKVYLTMAGLPLQDPGAMMLAHSKIKEVIDNASQFGYALMPDYEDAIRVKNNAERIFAVQQTRSVEDHGTAMAFVWGGQFWPYGQAGGGGQYHGGFTQSFYDLFEDEDVRRDVTMAYTYSDVRNPSNILTYGVPPLNLRFGIAPNKYQDSQQNCCNGDPDIIIFRYADALLMYAEIENTLNGPSSEAYNYLNLVRQRAGASDAPAGMSQREFADFVYNERFLELSFEFHEVFDIRRLGKVEETLKIHPENITWEPTNTPYSLHFELWPIPLSEVQTNPNLGQTPGW